MEKQSIAHCIDEILLAIVQRKSVDYGDKASVRRFNTAYDRMIQNARYLDLHYPDQIDALMKLLYHDDLDVVVNCAPIILTLENSTFSQKWEAIAVIRSITTDKRICNSDRLGFSVSLKRWEKRLKQMTDANTNGSVW